MAYRRQHPGSVVTDEAIDRYAEENDLALVVPPRRRLWPLVVLVATISITAGISIGVAVSTSVTLLQVALVVCAIFTAIAGVTYMECRREDDGGDHG